MISRKQPSRQRGFTLMETVVALAITGIALGLVTPAFILNAKSNTLSEQKSQALEATQRVIDTTRLNSPSMLPSTGSTTQDITVGGRTFTIRTNYCVTASLCSAVTRHLKFTALLRGKQLYETETVFTQLR